jgi:hypothetical protein
MTDNGPVYDSPGALPEKDDFKTREEFLAVYPDEEHLADIYFPNEDEVTPPA